MKNACPKGYTMSHQGVCIETKTDTPTRTNTINISGIGEIQLPTFNKASYHYSNPIMPTSEHFQHLVGELLIILIMMIQLTLKRVGVTHILQKVLP